MLVDVVNPTLVDVIGSSLVFMLGYCVIDEHIPNNCVLDLEETKLEALFDLCTTVNYLNHDSISSIIISRLRVVFLLFRSK